MTKKTQKKTVPADLRESAHKIWLAGLGALAVAEEEGSKAFKNLVKKGEGLESRSKKQVKKVKDEVEDRVGEAREKAESAWDKMSEGFDEKVSATLQRLGVPTRIEIQKLTKRVEELTIKVDQLKPKTRRTSRTKSQSTA